MSVGSWLLTFILLSLISGSLAIYFYIQIYRRLAKASLAWLLLTVASIFMIGIPLIPTAMLIKNSLDLTLLILLLCYWSAVYTSFFAAAGYVLYKAFVYVPRKSIGKFIFEGYERKRLKPLKNETLKKLSKYVLIIHTPEERYEDAIIKLSLMHIGEERGVAIVTSKQKAKALKEYLKEFIESKKISITKKPQDADIARDSLLIFDLSMNNIDYDFLASYIEQFKGCRFVAFADKRNAFLEGLFIDLFELRDGVIRSIKSKERVTIPVESIIDYTAYNLRGGVI